MMRGIVEDISGHLVKVRIPTLHKISEAVGATPTKEIPFAPICTMPGCRPNLRVGDIVLVDFENRNANLPIVVGMLFNDNSINKQSDLTLSSLKVDVNVDLPKDTKIGEVSAQSIQYLLGLSENLAEALSEIRKRLENVEGKITL